MRSFPIILSFHMERILDLKSGCELDSETEIPPKSSLAWIYFPTDIEII